jgi:hexosaminidase
MKNILFIIYILPLCCFAQGINIIPQPSHVQFSPGLFNFQKGLSIKVYGDNAQVNSIARIFANRLFDSKEWKVPASGEGAKSVVLQLLPGRADSASDASYFLCVTQDSVLIQAYTCRGLFYGCQSAAQLFINSVLTYQMPCVAITDTPHFDYRGMELDVCRHFFPKEVIKNYLNLMTHLKMNVFHWHLTDDQGWRIEIKKYPRLTEIGAWRTDKNGQRYGGFYTQDDIREIVAYAAERYITVIPEIELPGHSSAAIAAYPWLSCNEAESKTVPNSWGVKKDIYSPTDSTFMFLQDVLDEICNLFPSPLIHLGGDEAPKAAWKTSAVAQALIKKENLKNEEELQHFFLKKMEDYLAAKGKQCIGWGEIVKGGLSDNVVVMSWLDKKAGKKAVQHGNRVIMTPRFYCYFDYPQSIRDKKQAWWMAYLGLRKVYAFSPTYKLLPAAKSKLILGGQANVWTEYIPDEKQLKHQVMPRLAAMAEALWSQHKNYSDFQERLNTSANLF